MSTDQAISVLVTGAKIGQSKGAFTLEDASVIMEAIKVLTPKPEPAPVVEGAKEDDRPVETLDKEL